MEYQTENNGGLYQIMSINFKGEEEMKVLKIEEEYRQELTEKGVVICTYEDLEGSFFDGICETYSKDYNFELIEIKLSE